MSLSLVYWVLMLIWLVFSAWSGWAGGIKASGGSIVPFLLLLVIGWKVFGAPVHS